MLACHRARIEYLLANGAKGAAGRNCVFIHAKNGFFRDAENLAKKNANGYLSLIHGISECLDRVDDRALRLVDRSVPHLSVDEIHQWAPFLLRIYSVHGATRWAIDSGLVDKLKKYESVCLIGVLRKMAHERNFVMKLFLKEKRDDSDALVIDWMSTVCALNGWHDRVSLFASGLNSQTKETIIAKLIRAYCHYPHGKSAVEPIWKLAAGREMSSIVRDALVEFYAVNSQFSYCLDLISLLPPTVSSFRVMFRNFSNHEHVFKLADAVMQQSKIDEYMCHKIVNALMETKDFSRMELFVEYLFLKNSFPKDPIIRGKLLSLVDHTEIPPDNRTAALIRMCDVHY